MKKLLKFSFCFLFIFSSLTVPGFSKNPTSASAVYQQGCSAFSRGDWDTAVFLLRQTVADPTFDTADANYMLIMAEIYAGDNKSALSDCDDFLNSFSRSLYTQRIFYTKGKLLYNLGEYEKAIVTLSDFCHKNEGHELYPSALFYIAESLYAGYKFDEAEDIYEKIACQLIGMEVILSKEQHQFKDGYTTGKARISRKLLKREFNISSQIQLDSLRDALNEKGYYLIEIDYASDLFLLNIRNFLINVRNIDQSVIDTIHKDIAEINGKKFLNAQEEKRNKDA